MQNEIIDAKTNDHGMTGAMAAARNGRLEVLKYLIDHQASLDAVCKDNNTLLHYACDSEDKECILYLVLLGLDPEARNVNNAKPGDGKMEVKTFLNNIICEKECFNVLTPAQKNKLKEIFNDIDHNSTRSIDLDKAIRFNKFVEGDSVSQ
jgi:ankyrin repeat protein